MTLTPSSNQLSVLFPAAVTDKSACSGDMTSADLDPYIWSLFFVLSGLSRRQQKPQAGSTLQVQASGYDQDGVVLFYPSIGFASQGIVEREPHEVRGRSAVGRRRRGELHTIYRRPFETFLLISGKGHLY